MPQGDDQGVMFTRRGARRIGSVVRRVESTPHRGGHRNLGPRIVPGINWALFEFGYEKTGATTYEIKAGEIAIGPQAAVAVVDTPVTITVDFTYVGWQYIISSKVLSIENFGTSITNEAGKIKKWLYVFRLVSGDAYVGTYGLLNPIFPAVLGDV